MRCTNCNSELPGGALFCGVCGQKLGGKTNVNNTVCPVCGAKSDQNSGFCTRCGYSFKKKSRQSKSRNDVRSTNILIAFIIILVICLAVMAYVLYRYNAGTYSDGRIPFRGNSEVGDSFSGDSISAEYEFETIGSIVNNVDIEDDDVSEDVEDDTDYGFEAFDKDEEYEEEEYEDEDYIFPSDTVYIREKDLARKSRDEIALIRNEIYARHGYIFHTEPFKSYFESKEWYHPNENFSESLFNEIEEANKDFLVNYEKDMGWR